MTQFNRSGEQFFPFGYPGIDLYSQGGREDTKAAESGLYYRSRVAPDLSQAIDKCLDGTSSFADMSFDALQAWNESAWKVPHGTLAASTRFADKLGEELDEAEQALEEFRDTRDNRHLIEEIGDVGWGINALASNGRAVISDSLKDRVYSYLTGTRIYTESGSFDYPDWYDEAAKFVVRRGPLNIGDVDALVGAGFVPQHSPVMNLYEPEKISPTHELCWNFKFYIPALRSLNEQLHGSETYIPHDNGEHISHEIGKIAAEATLRIAAIAHYAGSSFEEVVSLNIAKINNRITLNIIDKSDGERT